MILDEQIACTACSIVNMLFCQKIVFSWKLMNTHLDNLEYIVLDIHPDIFLFNTPCIFCIFLYHSVS